MVWMDEDDEPHYPGDTKDCDTCDGAQKWCSTCGVFSADCHEPWGTCACS